MDIEYLQMIIAMVDLYIIMLMNISKKIELQPKAIQTIDIVKRMTYNTL